MILGLSVVLFGCGGEETVPIDTDPTNTGQVQEQETLESAPEPILEPIIASIGESVTIGAWEIEITNIARNGWLEDDDGLISTAYRAHNLLNGRHERLNGRGGNHAGVYCGTHFCSNFRNGDHIAITLRVVNESFLPAVFLDDSLHEDRRGAFEVNIVYDGEHRFPPSDPSCNMRLTYLHDNEFLPERSFTGLLVFEILVERIFNSPDIMLEITDGTNTVLFPLV